MQACLPALQQGAASLRGWHEVLIYPGEFKLRRSDHDELTDVPAEGSEVLTGKARQHAPLVLSLADVQLDLEQPWDGYNVVVHEVAHKLDMLDGPADGVPPLMDIPRRRWVEPFQQAYDRLVNTSRGNAHSPIDSYAAQSMGEYFAVVSELHYSRPELLRQTEPQVAHLLQAYYGRSPADAPEPAKRCNTR